jgi:hypothetical protein
MGLPTKESIRKNTELRRKWEIEHPGRNWKSGYSEQAIKEIEEARRAHSQK